MCLFIPTSSTLPSSLPPSFPHPPLPGFGVSSSHYERNIGPLSSAGHHIYAIDYLGQGKSWPDKDPKQEDNLVFSIDMWSEQIVSFIKDVIGRPVYISGNSLGGFLATTVAAQHPEWVKGVILLNSTPFWSFAPNRKKLQKWVKEVCFCGGREGRREGGRGSIIINSRITVHAHLPPLPP